MMSTDTEERLMKSTEYHIHDWAQRLEEVGGPGVGGTELAYIPPFLARADTTEEEIRMALETSIPSLWQDAAWCYVYGQFRACVVLAASLLEVVLKYELYKQNPSVVNKKEMLGSLITKSGRNRILGEAVISLANNINQRRNAVVHANIQLDRPDTLLHHTGIEHEEEPIKDLSRNITPDGWLTGDGEVISISFGGKSPGYSRVFLFRKAARDTLFEVREILKSLYPSILS